MAFDIHAEIRALKAANAADRAKAELLDKLFDSGRPLEAIEAFLDAFPGDICNISWYLPSAERLFKAELVTAYQPRHLKKLCEMLLERGYGFAMRRAAEIVTDSRIPANRRALFWHVIRSAEYMGDGLPGGAFAKGVFADNAAARRCWSRYGEDPDEKAFVGNTSVENRDKKIAAAMCAAAQNDSVSIMEIERTLRGGTAGVSAVRF